MHTSALELLVAAGADLRAATERHRADHAPD